MKKINRLSPSSDTLSALNLAKADIEYTSLLSDKITNRKRLWVIGNKYSREPIKSTLHKDILKMQLDRECAYCEVKPTWCACTVEHIKPKLDYPENNFDWENFLMCCPNCNRKKNDDFPAGFLDPSEWNYNFNDHFSFRDNVYYECRTNRAEVTWECIWLNDSFDCWDGWNKSSFDERREIFNSLMQDYIESGVDWLRISMKVWRNAKWFSSYIEWLKTSPSTPISGLLNEDARN